MVELGEKPIPSSGTKTCPAIPKASTSQGQTNILSNYIFFYPLPTLSRVRIWYVATFLPNTLDQVHLALCGPTPLKDHPSRTIWDTIYNKDFRDWETPSQALSHKPNPQILSSFP